MIATSVGYAGGAEPDPTYRRIGDHTESFQIIYDPGVISFDDLLEVLWTDHNPYSQSWSTQYMNIAFYENDVQQQAIEKSIRELEAGGRKVKTRVARLDSYTLAEDYHQKHSLRRFSGFTEELEKKYPGESWMFTYEATKLNGYLGSNGSCEELEKEVRSFGLSSALEVELLALVCSKEGRKGEACPVPVRKQ